MIEFRHVTTPKLLERLEKEVAQLLDGPWHFREDALVRRSWTAVPVEKGRHIELDHAARIAASIQNETSAPCYALATEPTGDQPRGYEVMPSETGLLSFSHECAGLNFILVPSEITFAILFTSEDYNIYAGSKRFIETALGTSVPAARAAFHEYADDPWWEGRLLEVSRRYNSLG